MTKEGCTGFHCYYHTIWNNVKCGSSAFTFKTLHSQVKRKWSGPAFPKPSAFFIAKDKEVIIALNYKANVVRKLVTNAALN
jgi:hypothetical protein